MVANRLQCHLNAHRLRDNQQFAYRKGHSRETVLLNIHHHIAEVIDIRCIAALALLDLSFAFGIIQKRLEYSFGVT